MTELSDSDIINSQQRGINMFYVIIQKIISVLLSLIVLAIPGIKWKDSMDGHAFPIISAEEKAPDTVRVMSFNIRCEDVNGTPALLRRNIVIREILKVAPDILGIQEATPAWMITLKTLLPAYGCVGISRDNGKTIFRKGESCPIFYLKEKYELVDNGDFWLSDTPDEPSFGPGAGCRRICTWALLRDKEKGSLVAHVNTHLDNVSDEARVLGAEMILDHIASRFPDTPVIFTADLNSTEDESAYNLMSAQLTDAHIAAADSVFCYTCHDGDPGGDYMETIDYVMCSDDITVNSFRTVTDGIDGRLVSDHFPIYADVTLPAAEESVNG